MLLLHKQKASLVKAYVFEMPAMFLRTNAFVNLLRMHQIDVAIKLIMIWWWTAKNISKENISQKPTEQPNYIMIKTCFEKTITWILYFTMLYLVVGSCL